MRWKAEYLQAVFPSSHAVNQVLELGLDDMEIEEQKHLTKCAALKSSRSHAGDFREFGKQRQGKGGVNSLAGFSQG